MDVVLMQVVMGNVDTTLQRPPMLKEGHLRGLRIPHAVSTSTQGSRTAGASGDVVKAVHFRVLKILPGPPTPEGVWCCLLLCKKDSLRWRRLCTPCRFCLAVCSSQWPATAPSTAICQPQLPPCILDCGPGSSNCRPWANANLTV